MLSCANMSHLFIEHCEFIFPPWRHFSQEGFSMLQLILIISTLEHRHVALDRRCILAAHLWQHASETSHDAQSMSDCVRNAYRAWCVHRSHALNYWLSSDTVTTRCNYCSIDYDMVDVASFPHTLVHRCGCVCMAMPSNGGRACRTTNAAYCVTDYRRPCDRHSIQPSTLANGIDHAECALAHVLLEQAIHVE